MKKRLLKFDAKPKSNVERIDKHKAAIFKTPKLLMDLFAEPDEDGPKDKAPKKTATKRSP